MPLLPGRKEKGRRGEALAAAFLQRQGFTILRQSYRTRYGEVDLIAREGPVLCFIEVKTRSHLGFGLPIEAVTRRKRKRLALCAQTFVARNKLEGVPLRFDVVSVLEAEGDAQVELFRAAFDNPLKF